MDNQLDQIQAVPIVHDLIVEAENEEVSTPINDENAPPEAEDEVTKFTKSGFKKEQALVRWFYTYNNYTEEARTKLIDYLKENGKYHICGREGVGPDRTPHLQGMFILRTKDRWTKLVRELHAAAGDDKLSLYPVRNLNAAIKYCKKEGDFVETGTPPGKAGGDNLAPFKTAVKTGKYTTRELREMFSSDFARSRQFCLDYIEDNRSKPEPWDLPGPLRPFQVELKKYVDGPVNRREFLFVVDITGNSGKSTFASWMTDNDPMELTDILEMGTKENMMFDFAVYDEGKYPGTLFVDCERADAFKIQYGVLVKIKEGRFISHKFKAKRIRYNPPHMVLMMNEFPNWCKLSEDRFKVMILDSNLHANPNDPDDETRGEGYRWMSREEIATEWAASFALEEAKKKKND